MIEITTPISEEIITNLKVGDMISLSGYIYTGRDAVLPKVVSLIQSNELSNYNIKLEGAVIFHTAVSPAGVGPTSSNKYEIESSIPILSQAGVKMHLGKGALNKETIRFLNDYRSVYAIIPPVTALLNDMTLEKQVIAFPELGMEALHLLKIKEFPIIIAAANGKSIYDEK